MNWTQAEIMEHRRQWTAALRSGDYPQAIGALRSNDGFCCLGVAEHVRGSEVVYKPAEGLYYYGTGDGQNSAILTPETMEWLGLRYRNPVAHTPEGESDGLAGLNDARVSFWEIANLIDAQEPSWDGSVREYQPAFK